MGGLLSILASGLSIILMILQLWRGYIFRRERSLRSVLMFHNAVFEGYEGVTEKIRREFEGGNFGLFLLKWLIIAFGIGSIMLYKCNFDVESAAILGILASSVIAPLLTLSLGRALLNVSLPVLVLVFFLFGPLLHAHVPTHTTCENSSIFIYNVTDKHLNVSNNPFLVLKNVKVGGNSWIYVEPMGKFSEVNCTVNLSVALNSSCNFRVCRLNYSFNNTSKFCKTFYVFGNIFNSKETPATIGIAAIVAYLLEVLLLLLVSRVPLMVEGRWISALKEDTIKSSVFGVLLTFSLSGMLTILWVWSLPSSVSYLFLVGVVGMIILAYIVSDVKSTAIRLLWKVRLPEFSDKLPHLLVKTKTGNIFFGQLYDPLDEKLLILGKAKLIIHGGQSVFETLNEAISIPSDPENEIFGSVFNFQKRANYVSIPWDEIEALQIIEEGLYRTPEMPTENKSSDVKKEKEASKRPEQETPDNEQNKEQEDNPKKE